MCIHEIMVYTDFKLDESYTPSKISIRAGTTFHDLQEIHVEELNEPSGWVERAAEDARLADGLFGLGKDVLAVAELDAVRGEDTFAAGEV